MESSPCQRTFSGSEAAAINDGYRCFLHLHGTKNLRRRWFGRDLRSNYSKGTYSQIVLDSFIHAMEVVVGRLSSGFPAAGHHTKFLLEQASLSVIQVKADRNLQPDKRVELILLHSNQQIVGSGE